MNGAGGIVSVHFSKTATDDAKVRGNSFVFVVDRDFNFGMDVHGELRAFTNTGDSGIVPLLNSGRKRVVNFGPNKENGDHYKYTKPHKKLFAFSHMLHYIICGSKQEVRNFELRVGRGVCGADWRVEGFGSC